MKASIYTLGCKVNIYESEYVLNLLKENNYEIVDFEDWADIYIINTCTVTNESDRKSRKIIREARRRNKDAVIVAMGCYTQINKDNVDADIVIGTKDKSKIISLIDEYLMNKEKINIVCDLCNIKFEDMLIDTFYAHTRAFVKIEDGCNEFCTYCVIPYSRGRIRSKSVDKVIEEITLLVNNGYKEIVLTGIHIGKYGVDIDTNLEYLLSKILKIDGLYRLRLSSIEINEITDGILNLFAKNDILANHLHIPMQSGSNKILKSMNRKYTKDYFIKRINEIRKIRKDISITTDLIVGFPFEDEDDFRETLDTLRKIRFTHIHTFPYSRREGTPASVMKGQVDGNLKKMRVREVIDLSNEMEEEFYRNNIGKIYTGVVEINKNGECFIHSDNFIPILLDKFVESNKIVTVRINLVQDLKVYGKVIDGDESG